MFGKIKNYLYFWNEERDGCFSYYNFVNKIIDNEYNKKDLIKINNFIGTDGKYIIKDNIIYKMYCNIIVNGINIICASK